MRATGLIFSVFFFCAGIIWFWDYEGKDIPISEKRAEIQEARKTIPQVERGQKESPASLKAETVKKTPVHYADDPKWSKKIENRGDNRELRHGVSKAKITFDKKHLDWKAGKSMPRKEIEALVRKVFRLMPHIRTNNDIVNLVVETAIAESWGGEKAIKNRFGDCGMFQIKGWIARETLDWLKYAHNDIYQSIMKLRNGKLSEEDNLIRNLPYAAAMCITCYWRSAGANFPRYATSLQKRAELWKSVYNTRKGAGTVNDYIARVKKFS